MLNARNLYFEFHGEDAETDEKTVDEILKGINLNIKNGEFVAVLGRNGSGKSTLAKHFNALLLPTRGKVYANGLDTADDSRLFDIRSSVGMVFQNPDNQIVAATVEDDVAFAPENLGMPPAEIRKRVDESLAAVGMTEYKHAEPQQLSGGQKQRAAIAGVLAMLPKCIVFDEPTAMLDPRGRDEVMAAIRKLNRENGITVVLITHYMDEAAEADRIIVIDDGKIAFDDVPKKVFSNMRELKKLGFDSPQVTELLNLLKAEGLDVETDILTVEDCAAQIARALGAAEGGDGDD